MILKIRDLTKYPLTLIVGICMVATLLGYIFGSQHEFSDVENRYLKLRPAASLQGIVDGSFMSDFDTYTNEQMPLREELVKLKTLVDTVVGKIENHGIAKGKDGYLFDKSTADLSQFETNLTAIDKFIKNSDRQVYVAFAPTSVAVNADKLPKGMPVLDEKKMNEWASLYMSVNKNGTFIDLYKEMVSRDGENLYYSTDHHWKTQAAYYAYKKICDVMSTDITVSESASASASNGEFLKAVDITNIPSKSSPDFYGTFYAKYQALGTTPDSIEYFDTPELTYTTDKNEYNSIYDESKLEIYDKYAMFMYGNFGHASIKVKEGTGRSLVIFKDSYANCLIPFLTYNYDTIEIVDLRYMGGSVKELLDENPEADVLMLYNYSFLNEDNHFYKLFK